MHCFARLLQVMLASTLLAALFPVPLRAQCADGTPPPCEVQAQQVVARAEVPDEAERGRSFLILPFRNITRAPEHEWLVEGSPMLLADALGQWEEISVVPPERLAPALRRHGLKPGEVMDEAGVRRVAEETGGWTAVTGEVLAMGNRIRVSARAYDVATGRVVVSARGEGDLDDPRSAYEDVASQLLRTAGLDVSIPNLRAVTTQSLDAYKAYQRGVAHYNRAEMAQAREALLEAVRLDSTFAQAYAKLAEASATTIESLMNPQSPLYRYAERALALSQRLPRRDRELVQHISDLLRGNLSTARERLERLVAEDSNDVEALQYLADIEGFDPILVMHAGGERPRGSLNTAALLAKRALSLDPSRHENYSTLVGVYQTAGGEHYGRVVGLREEQPSLVALAQAMMRPTRTFIAVLRDTIELVPADSLDLIPEDSLESARDRARAIASAWVERWLAAAPGEGVAHLKASEVYALNEQYDQALEHLVQAESLGVEFEPLANFADRRVQILTRGERYSEALVLADSLEKAGQFTGPSFAMNPLAQNAAAWVFNLYLLVGRFAEADSLVTRLGNLLVQGGQMDSLPALHAILRYYSRRTDARSSPALPDIPSRLRDAMLDSVVARIEELPSDGILRQHFPDLVFNTLRGADEEHRRAVGKRLLTVASRLLDERDAELAGRVVRGAVAADTSTTGRAEMAELLREALRAVPNADLAATAVIVDTTVVGRLAIFKVLERLVEGDPNNLEAVYQLGKIGALTGGNLEVAQASLERYLQREPPPDAPSHASAHWRLGMIHERRGDPDRARAAYEAALKLDPNLAQAREALAKLPPKQ